MEFSEKVMFKSMADEDSSEPVLLNLYMLVPPDIASGSTLLSPSFLYLAGSMSILLTERFMRFSMMVKFWTIPFTKRGAVWMNLREGSFKSL